MLGNGRHGGQYRRSGVVEGEQDELLQVLPLVLEGTHLGPVRAAVAVRDVHNCTECVSAPVRLRCAQWPLTPQNQIVSSLRTPQRIGRASGPVRGPIGTPGRAGRRMHSSSTDGALGTAIRPRPCNALLTSRRVSLHNSCPCDFAFECPLQGKEISEQNNLCFFIKEPYMRLFVL